MFLYLPVRAQDTNLKYWAAADSANKRAYRSMKVNINYVFLSRILNDSTEQAINDCHILNQTLNTGTVSDTYGDFKITANVGDTIAFSALGYQTKTIVITESMFNYGHIIRLKPASYTLSEITIKPYQLKLPSISRFQIYTPPLPNQGGINIPLPSVIEHPISAIYDRFSKEGKQKQYYKSLLNGTAEYMIIGEKFNGEMVTQLTGLKDDKLIQFMTFCNFSNEFLMTNSPKTIERAIRRKYQEYISSNTP
jgi:hypothetical protein